MNILLAGQKRFGADVLDLLVERGDNVLAVACPVTGDKPDRLCERARALGVPIIPSGTLRAETMPAGVDLIVAAHSHDFIGRTTRLRARLGAIGYHPSLLPRHRGRSAIEWALRFGEAVTGGTIYWLNDVVDGGDLAAQEHVFIQPGETALELWARELAPLGLRLFGKVLADIDRGHLVMEPQNHEMATWEPAIDNVPRLYRPDLPLLTDGRAETFQIVRDRKAA